MSFKIEFMEGIDALKVCYTGKVTLETKLKALDDISNWFEKFSPKNLLIDTRSSKMDMSILQQYNFGTRLAACRALSGKKIAVVHAFEIHENKFINTVAANRGYYTKDFSSIEEASVWLTR